MKTALTLTPIEQIDALAQNYNTARNILADRVQHLQDELAAAQRRLIKGIKAAAAEAATAKSQLEAAITANPDCFIKPRTITLHGIKLGLKKGTGKIEFDDAEAVVARIEKMFPDAADVLIITTKKPNKEALAALDVASLRKLGCTVEESGDQVVIKGATDAVDKYVAKLLEEGSEQAEAA